MNIAGKSVIREEIETVDQVNISLNAKQRVNRAEECGRGAAVRDGREREEKRERARESTTESE